MSVNSLPERGALAYYAEILEPSFMEVRLTVKKNLQILVFWDLVVAPNLNNKGLWMD